jgi:hypothetical protein
MRWTHGGRGPEPLKVLRRATPFRTGGRVPVGDSASTDASRFPLRRCATIRACPTPGSHPGQQKRPPTLEHVRATRGISFTVE